MKTTVQVFEIESNQRTLTINQRKTVLKKTKEMKLIEIQLEFMVNRDGKNYVFKKKMNILKDRINKTKTLV
jgi:hypothetical protein